MASIKRSGRIMSMAELAADRGRRMTCGAFFRSTCSLGKNRFLPCSQSQRDHWSMGIADYPRSIREML